MSEEAVNQSSLADSAEAMRNMKPEDIDRLLVQFDTMPATQREQLKDLGMDPDLMKKSMLMMKQNPAIMKSAQKMMENMTPEEIAKRSQQVQEQMSKMAPEQLDSTVKAMSNLNTDDISAVEAQKSSGISSKGSSNDPDVLDAMFRVAEFMSTPPSGGVTFKAFSTLPPIVALGGNSEEDLSPAELRECWADGSLGSPRVDREGFKRVWLEVQEYFEADFMGEARKTIVKKTASSATSVTYTTGNNAAVVGATLKSEQLKSVNEEVKNMSDEQTKKMFEEMSNMTPEQEARVKAMGVNPEMLKKTTDVMKDNPLMRKAAQAMMKNMSPEQMLKMSQEAQKQMSKMSPEDYDRTLEQFKNK